MHLTRTSVLAAPVVIGLLFSSTLIGVERLAFRDVSHFYTPLYDYVARRGQSQWLPLWNPLDQTGIPLVGESTTAFFYPVRYLLFSLPIPSESALAWYVVLHLVLASLAARLCGLWVGASRVSATTAGIIYPLSGTVLFLYTNPPFLVGAAWLPLVLGAAIGQSSRSFAGSFDRRSVQRRKRILIAAVAMAMMVLGGDPQIALHATIVVAIVAVFRMAKRGSADRHRQAITLLAMPIVAAALSAPQIAASFDWSRQSDRVGEDVGHWLDPPGTDSRRYEAFQFSLPPWHSAEILTPNASGSLLPVSKRIASVVAGDGRMWTPTIYMGMLVVVALLSRIVRIRSKPVDAWLTLAITSLFLSSGHFGLVWLLQNTTGSFADADSAIGGPYWFLYHFFPGYDAFRYPTKWLPFFSLSSAILTAQWMDHRGWRDAIATKRIGIGLLAALLVASALVYCMRIRPGFLFEPQNLPVDPFWGPLDFGGGLAEVQWSLLHSLFFLIAILLVLHHCRRRNRRHVRLCLLAIVLLDLTIASRGSIHQIPARAEAELLARLSADANLETVSGGRSMRTRAGDGWPGRWIRTNDVDRLLEVEASARHCWFGRWHLQKQQPVLNSMTSIQSRPMALFWKASRRVTAEMDSQEREQFWGSVRKWLGVDQVIHLTGESKELPLSSGSVATVVDVMLIHAPHGGVIERRAAELGEGDDVLSIDAFCELLRSLSVERGSETPELEVRLVCDEPEQLDLEVNMNSTGLIVRPTLQDGNWIVEYTEAEGESNWRQATVRRVDYLKQGVRLPAGHWRVRFRYAPFWPLWSLPIAAMAWCMVLFLIVGRFSAPGNA